MKKLSFLLCIFCFCFGLIFGESLFPKPQSQVTPSNPQMYQIDPLQFTFIATNVQTARLQRAIGRYVPLTFFDGLPLKKVDPKSEYILLEGLDINVQSDNENLTLQTNENYTLTISAPRASLFAGTVYGAIRGLETFSQLVNKIGDAYFINQTKIIDFPRFAYRGVMIDTSRHYLPLSAIYENIDAMSYTKMNILHWHIVDDQSFPYISSTYPLLSQKGSYQPGKHTYSHAEIKSIVEYAKDRAIRVIPEFDTPGHTYSWGHGYPYLLTECYQNGKVVGYGPFNPVRETTYTFMTNFFSEVLSIFPDAYIHIGGDEVDFSCWQSNPEIQQWMKNHSYTDYSAVEQYYETRILQILNQLNHDYIVWQEIFDNGLKVNPNTVIDVWKGGWQNELAAVTKTGLRAILSSPWYLNYISYGADWVNYYAVEPSDFSGTEQQKELVVGGHSCMWGEYVDSTNLVSRLWPRSCAVGERLWSSKDTRDVNDAGTRLGEHRCRLVRRKIRAEPFNGPSFCPQEYDYEYRPSF